MLGVLVFLLFIAAFGAGVVIGRVQRTPRNERAQLARYSQLVDNLYDEAADHVALGDPFASIVFDEIRTHRTKEVK